HVRTLRLRSLRRVEKPRRAALICGCVDFPDFGECAAVVLAVRLLVGLECAGLEHPALLIDPCGGVLVENNIRGPTTLLAAEIQLSRGQILELADVVRRRPERSSQLLASRYPRRVHVDCPGPVREDVPSDGFLGEGLAGENDRLKRGLQRRAPTIPLLSLRGCGSGD